MGNCLFGGLGPEGIGIGGDENGDIDNNEVIQVITANGGGIMEFGWPITVELITEEFPGHGIFRSQLDLFWKPLAHHQVLEAGHCYYLLPLDIITNNSADDAGKVQFIKERSVPMTLPSSQFCSAKDAAAFIKHVRSNTNTSVDSSPVIEEAEATPAPPYRMSFDHSQRRTGRVSKRWHTKRTSRHDDQCYYGSRSKSSAIGIWKVKLVISPQHLLQILSQEGRTQELIESVRTVAKSRNAACHSSLLFPGAHWSLSAGSSSSRRTTNDESSNHDALLIDF